MKKIATVVAAGLVAISLSSCGGKTPSDCTTALNAADNLLEATSRAAEAATEHDQAKMDGALSDMRVSKRIYDELSQKCRAESQ